MIPESVLAKINEAIREILRGRGFRDVGFDFICRENEVTEIFETIMSDPLAGVADIKRAKIPENYGSEKLKFVEFCKACNDYRTFLYNGVEDNEPICDTCGHAKGW
jgi:hypothetical protein